MLTEGVKSSILNAQAIEGNNPLDLAAKLRIWLNEETVIIHDIQILQSQEKTSAVIIFRGVIH